MIYKYKNNIKKLYDKKIDKMKAVGINITFDELIELYDIQK